jgi:methionine biosynthesis protein MetW
MMSVPERLHTRLHSYRAPLPMQSFDGYDEYWDARGGEPIIHPRWQIAVSMIPDGATVLDVGCGAGGFLTYLLGRRPHVRARGTDISARAVDTARRAGLDAFRADLTRERLEGRYDYVTCFETIEHIADAEAVAEALRDATRLRLIMSLPNFGYIHHRIRHGLFGRFPNTNLKFHVKEHIRHWGVQDFTEWAAALGLRVVSVQGQYGGRYVPWRRYPSLFSPQLVYVLEPVSPCTGARSAS